MNETEKQTVKWMREQATDSVLLRIYNLALLAYGIGEYRDKQDG